MSSNKIHNGGHENSISTKYFVKTVLMFSNKINCLTKIELISWVGTNVKKVMSWTSDCNFNLVGEIYSLLSNLNSKNHLSVK